LFERFSREARNVVTAAVAEAERRGDDHVGTDHLLAGLCATSDPSISPVGIGIEELRTIWLGLDRAALEATGIPIDLPTGMPRSRTGHIPFTSGAKETLTATLRETLELGSRKLEPEHILIALTLRSPRDPAIRLLDAAGLNPDAIRAEVIRSLRKTA
jgi:ATP-dependent Clp protease ATP-binding subunit ClpA